MQDSPKKALQRVCASATRFKINHKTVNYAAAGIGGARGDPALG